MVPASESGPIANSAGGPYHSGVRPVRSLLFLLVLVLQVPVSQAGSLVLDIFENPANTGSAGPQSLGWQFQVNTPIFVDGLAFWDHTDTQSHDVGIYNDTTQVLLVSTTILPSDPVSGTGPWRVHSISPFLLTPGVYDIAAETGSDNYTFGASITTVPEITFLRDAYAFGASTLMFPSGFSGGGLQAWFGPSFTATDAVVGAPESGLFALMGTGLAVLAGIARRKR
jgi:hypothetical protein